MVYLSLPLVLLAVSFLLLLLLLSSMSLSPKSDSYSRTFTAKKSRNDHQYRTNLRKTPPHRGSQSRATTPAAVIIVLSLLLTTATPKSIVPFSLTATLTTLPVILCYLDSILFGFILPRNILSNSTLMSVDTRICLNCLRYPSRFMPVSRTQLSRVHTGDSIQNIQRT